MHVHQLLRHAARVDPRGIALLGEQPRSHGELARRVAARAGWLARRGVGTGERVGLLEDNTPEFLEWTFAVAARGAVLVPLNTRLRPTDLAACLADAEARLLIAGSAWGREGREATATHGGSLECWVEGSGEDPALGRPLGVFAEPGEGELAHLYYTSGTTGEPKGVMLTHANVCRHALAAAVELELTADDTWGHIAPMFHLADAWATLAITMVGGRHAFLPRFEAGAALDLLEQRRVTLTNLVPTLLVRMVEHGSLPQRDLSSLRLVLSGGAPIAPDVVRRVVERFGAEYVQTYGMTETSPYLTLSKFSPSQRSWAPEERFAWSARTGRPFLGIELEVVDGEGRPVPADDRSVGEIRVRGATVTPGYWRRPEATAAALRGGWLYTGDLATLDEHGSVRIVDRAKDVVLTGGEKVYTTEVEAVLYRYPDLLECAVFARPDPEWGERVWAAVVPKEGAALDLERLEAHCRAHLAAYKIPRGYRVLDALPRTGTGKIAKRLLREADAPGSGPCHQDGPPP